MNTAVILFAIFLGAEPQSGRYQPPPYPNQAYSSTPTNNTGSLYGQRPPAPAAPVRSSGVRPAGYDNVAPGTVAPAQFETTNGWPQRPTDGLIGRTADEDAMSSSRRRGMSLPNTDADIPPAPISNYTPPNYARDTARPDDLSGSPTAGTNDARGQYNVGQNESNPPGGSSYPANQSSAPNSRYRSNEPSAYGAAPATNDTGYTTLPPFSGTPTPSPSNTSSLSVDEYSQPARTSLPRRSFTDSPTDYANAAQSTAAPVIPPPVIPTQTPTSSSGFPVDRDLAYEAPNSRDANAGLGIRDELRNTLQAQAPDLRGNSYFLTLLALFGSIGLNMYLGWISWDTYNRYQDLVGDIRYTSPRRGASGAREPVSSGRLAEGTAY